MPSARASAVLAPMPVPAPVISAVLEDAGRYSAGPVAVLLIGTLDTKGEELAFLRSRLLQAGVAVLLADAGTGGPPQGVRAGHRARGDRARRRLR